MFVRWGVIEPHTNAAIANLINWKVTHPLLLLSNIMLKDNPTLQPQQSALKNFLRSADLQ
jgi:hypothetical protein